MKKPCLPALISTLICLGFIYVGYSVLQISIEKQIIWKIWAAAISLLIFSAIVVLNFLTIKKLRCL